MKRQLPFISIVIPAYNEEKFLSKCLDALTNQTYPKVRYQIIVVDNNSTDNTAAIAKKFGAKVIEEKQQGHVYTINTGLQNATGDIYAMTDADSIPARNWLTNIARLFENPKVVGATGTVNLDFDSEIFNLTLKHAYYLVWQSNSFLHKPLLVGPNMAIRSSVFRQKLKQVDTRYRINGDVELGMRLRKHGKVIFSKDLSVISSSRRFKNGLNIKDLYKFTNAYIYSIWLEKPPTASLAPVGDLNNRITFRKADFIKSLRKSRKAVRLVIPKTRKFIKRFSSQAHA